MTGRRSLPRADLESGVLTGFETVKYGIQISKQHTGLNYISFQPTFELVFTGRLNVHLDDPSLVATNKRPFTLSSFDPKSSNKEIVFGNEYNEFKPLIDHFSDLNVASISLKVLRECFVCDGECYPPCNPQWLCRKQVRRQSDVVFTPRGFKPIRNEPFEFESGIYNFKILARVNPSMNTVYEKAGTKHMKLRSDSLVLFLGNSNATVGYKLFLDNDSDEEDQLELQTPQPRLAILPPLKRKNSTQIHSVAKMKKEVSSDSEDEVVINKPKSGMERFKKEVAKVETNTLINTKEGFKVSLKEEDISSDDEFFN